MKIFILVEELRARKSEITSRESFCGRYVNIFTILFVTIVFFIVVQRWEDRCMKMGPCRWTDIVISRD